MPLLNRADLGRVLGRREVFLAAFWRPPARVDNDYLTHIGCSSCASGTILAAQRSNDGTCQKTGRPSRVPVFCAVGQTVCSGPRVDFAGDSIFEPGFRVFQIEAGLKVDPEFGSGAEVAAQAQCRVRADPAFASDNRVEAIVRDPQRQSQRVNRNT